MNPFQTHHKLMTILKDAGWTVLLSESGSVSYLEPGEGNRWWTTDIVGAIQRQRQSEVDRAIAEGKMDPKAFHPLQS